MNPEHPAHGEVYGAAHFSLASPGDRQTQRWILKFDDADRRDMYFKDADEAWAAWNRFAPSYNCYLFTLASLTTPPATDVALREPDYIHEQHGPECACPKCWPDQPQIGDALLNPLYADMLTRPEVYGDLHATQIGDEERVVGKAIADALYPSDYDLTPKEQEIAARAAIAAMPKGDVGWQDISTAPKDGTEIIGYRRDQGTFAFRWTWAEEFVPKDQNGDPTEDYDESFACWWHNGWGWLEKDLTPTHWQPYPDEPPATSLRDRRA